MLHWVLLWKIKADPLSAMATTRTMEAVKPKFNPPSSQMLNAVNERKSKMKNSRHFGREFMAGRSGNTPCWYTGFSAYETIRAR
jgi:hypothetical protein